MKHLKNVRRFLTLCQPIRGLNITLENGQSWPPVNYPFYDHLNKMELCEALCMFSAEEGEIIVSSITSRICLHVTGLFSWFGKITPYMFRLLLFYSAELINQSSFPSWKRHSCASVHASARYLFMSQRFKPHVQTRLQRADGTSGRHVGVILFHTLTLASQWQLCSLEKSFKISTIIIMSCQCIFIAGSPNLQQLQLYVSIFNQILS